MERIHILIDKLYQQKQAAASPAHLLFTVQLLHQELSHLQNSNGAVSTSKVCITLPKNFSFSEEKVLTPFAGAPKMAPEEKKEIFVLDMVAGEEEEEINISETQPKDNFLSKPLFQESLFEASKPVIKEMSKPGYATGPLFNTVFDTVIEAPTLTQHNTKEVQHTIANVKESLNDRLKQEKTEVAHRLKEAPIKDLRKAIGINDRFVFVKELFRNDEAGYERSLKTINGFSVYSEAEYWMARELRLKLAWPDNNETVQHFYQLVKRRFA